MEIVQAQYNQIANYAFIQQEINIKIKDSSPAHYMTEVIGQCNTKKPVYGGIIEQDRLAENLKQNCIPDGFESMEIGDYQDFLQSVGNWWPRKYSIPNDSLWFKGEILI